MAGGIISTAQIFGLTVRESANDGSDFTNPGADYRRVFLGETGNLYLKDSSGALTQVGVGAGTAFPSSPNTNDRFHRTDHDQTFFYDGTRWLTTTLYRQSFGVGSTTFNTTTSGANAGRIPIAFHGLDLWMEKFQTAWYVGTTNNGSNFWTATLAKVTGNDVHTTIVAPTSAADSANTWVDAETSIGASVGVGTHEILDIVLTKTSSPGGIFFAGSLTFRVIAT